MENEEATKTFKYIMGRIRFKRAVFSRPQGHDPKLEGGEFKTNFSKSYFTNRLTIVSEFKHAWGKHI